MGSSLLSVGASPSLSIAGAPLLFALLLAPLPGCEGGVLTVDPAGLDPSQVTPAPALAPTILATLPVDGAADVPVGTSLSVVFDQAMSGDGSATLTPAADLVAAWDGEGAVLVLTPTEPLLPATPYTLLLDTDHTSADGLPLEGPASVTFTTAAPDPVLTVQIDPPQLATGVDRDTAISLTWSHPMDPDVGAVTLTGTQSGSDLPYTSEWAYQQNLTLHPDAPLAWCEDVFVTLDDGFASTDGLTHPSLTSTFATLAQPAPVATPSPGDGEQDVATFASLAVSFDLPMDTSVLPTVSWVGHSGGATVDWVDPTHLAIAPEAPFDTTTEITPTVSGVTDPCGAVVPDVTWQFRTDDCDASCPLPIPLAVNGGKLTGQTAASGGWALYELQLEENRVYTVEITSVSGTAVTYLTDPQSCGCNPNVFGALASQPFSLLPNFDVTMDGIVLDPGGAGTYHLLVGPQLLTGDVSFAVEVEGDPFQCADPHTYSSPVLGQAFAGGVAMDTWDLPQPSSVCTATEATVTPTGGAVRLLATSNPSECNPPLLRDLGTAGAGSPTTISLVQGEHLVVQEVGYPTGPGAVTGYDLELGSGDFPGCVDATGSHPWVVEEGNTPSFGATTWTVTVPAGAITTDTFAPPAIAGPCVVFPGSGRDDIVVAIQASGIAWLLDVQTCSAAESTITWVGTSLGQGDVASDNGSCGGACPGLFVAGQAEISGSTFGPGSTLFVHVEQGSQPGADTLWTQEQVFTITTRLF